MTTDTQERWIVVLSSLFPVLFCVGLALSWLARGAPAPVLVVPAPVPESPPASAHVPTTITAREPAGGAQAPLHEPNRIGMDPVAELQRRTLRLPIENARVESMRGDFAERRSGNTRSHEAVDILAPRHTPIQAVEDGTIARLFLSKAGGITVYQFDPSKRYCYYYAHLERYADNLREGQTVRTGDVLGYVGTTGNAPPSTPHLHFAIFELTADQRWWEGKAIDPYLVFSGNRPSGISIR